MRNAQNVRIKGIPRIKCEVCALIYARRVIFRRPGTHPAPRPFSRVHWDLFYFERGYDGSNYLLVLKDEYTQRPNL